MPYRIIQVKDEGEPEAYILQESSEEIIGCGFASDIVEIWEDIDYFSTASKAKRELGFKLKYGEGKEI